MWSSVSIDAISYRSLARVAGTTASAIDYHFGSIEHLYGAAQQHAVARAEIWLEEWIGPLQPLATAALAPAGRAAILAGLIDEWAQTQRPLALARLQACVATRRMPGTQEHALLRRASHQAWIALWRRAWHRLAAILGCPADGDGWFLFHEGLAPQHLLRGHRPLDRALLDEDVGLFLGLGQDRAEAPVRLAYQALLRADGAARPILLPTGPDAPGQEQPGMALEAAAAELLASAGIGALTYRAVAARAGCTLGQASWHFRSRAELLQKAFLRLYHEVAITTRPAAPIRREIMIDGTALAVSSGGQPVFGAFDEIILHVVHSEEHAGLSGPIRVFADPTARWATASLLGADEAEASAKAPVFSALCRGLDHLALAHPPEERAPVADLARRVLARWMAASSGAGPLRREGADPR